MHTLFLGATRPGKHTYKDTSLCEKDNTPCSYRLLYIYIRKKPLKQPHSISIK